MDATHSNEAVVSRRAGARRSQGGVPAKLVGMRKVEAPRIRYVAVSVVLEESGHPDTTALAHWVGRWNAKHAGDPGMMIRRRHGYLDINGVRRALEAEAEGCTPGLGAAKRAAGVALASEGGKT